MIRLSRILNLSVPPHLTPEEIDALPKITFASKTSPTSSVLLIEKCPICLTEFDDQETINKLHCTHLFHLQCISTWLSVSFLFIIVSKMSRRSISRKMIHVQHVVGKSWVIRFNSRENH